MGIYHGKILIGIVYHPPSSLVSYWERLATNIVKAMELELPVFILGDLNWNSLCKPNRLDEIVTDIGLRILNKEPTHYMENSATCIDVAMTSTPSRVNSVFTTSPGISNHSALIVTIDVPVPKGRSYKKKILSYKRTDWEAVNSTIKNEAWPPVNDYTSLDENVFIWSNKFQSIIERYTPTRIVKIEPWRKGMVLERYKTGKEKKRQRIQEAEKK